MSILEQPNASLLIRELRGRLGLTQQEFAEKLGVSFTSINRWENQHQQPTSLAAKCIRQMLEQMGDRGSDLLEKYFVETTQ
ncbi:MAG TPA: helix-turn-helix domain-containing protein [Elainellaceae cyanobacterium]